MVVGTSFSLVVVIICLQVGHGHLYGSRVLMKMTDPTRTVNIRHLAISTGNGQIGAWSFDDDLGKSARPI